MRLCVFEDQHVFQLDPLTLTRPAFDLWCGIGSLLERHQRLLPAEEVGLLVRPWLSDLCRENHPGWAINDPAWLEHGPTVLVNARWLPSSEPLADLDVPRVGLIGEQVAYIVLPSCVVPECLPETVAQWLHHWKQTLPCGFAGGVMIDFLWDLVEHNAATLVQDWHWFRQNHREKSPREGLAVVGPAEHLVMAASAKLEPFVVVDTRKGPVMIDEGAVVHSFSRLEGPCYVGRDSWLLGLKLRGGTIGPQCRVGGEFETSIMQGYSNKYHDGFLGHSYVGEWVNLAAGTQTSDLRNDYGPVTVWVRGERIPTGLTKVGTFIGDHTKTGLNTLFNTGSVIGTFCNLLPTDGYLPRLVPSFCNVNFGQLGECADLRQLLLTAATAMKRRGHLLSPAFSDFVFSLHDQTAPFRRQVIRDSELRRLRRTV